MSRIPNIDLKKELYVIESECEEESVVHLSVKSAQGVLN
jgi:hypothetical protein